LTFDFLRSFLPSQPAPPSPSLAGDVYTPVAGNPSTLAGNVYTKVAGNSPATKTSGHDALVRALMTAGRALSVTELAERMGCSVGEASKRVKVAGNLVRCNRDGRRKLVRLRQMSLTEWTALAASVRGEA